MIEVRENCLELETYLSLRASVNWKVLKREQAKLALERSIYTVTAFDGERAVGMGRMVGDGTVICYIQDFVVHPDYQGTGIGRMMMQQLISHAKQLRIEDSELMLCLMCAKGREKFYEKFGFMGRPTETLGPGMIQYLT